jgi:hypothetical protein
MCGHPKGCGSETNPFTAMFTKQADPTALGIKANETGVRRGWFLWPFNFDPVWLEECSGWEDRNQPII